jgi:hypothetical protein
MITVLLSIWICARELFHPRALALRIKSAPPLESMRTSRLVAEAKFRPWPGDFID